MDRAGSRLRALTGLLLALNLGLAGVGLGVAYWPRHEAMLPTMNAEQIRLAVTTPMPGRSRDATSVTSSASALPEGPEAAVMPSAAGRCLTWHQLDSERALALDQALIEAGLKVGDYAWELSEKLGWWVYAGPYEDSAQMRAWIAEAHRRGVADVEPVRGGPMSNAVSLGVFAELGHARRHADLMRHKGLQDVRYGLRPKVETARLILNKPDTPALTDAIRRASRGLLPQACEVSKP